jgi:predicted RNA polymerase sigma factor
VTDAREAITQVHHEEWARVVASLTRRFGDLDIAEALKLAAEGSKACNRKVEVRPFL